MQPRDTTSGRRNPTEQQSNAAQNQENHSDEKDVHHSTTLSIIFNQRRFNTGEQQTTS